MENVLRKQKKHQTDSEGESNFKQRGYQIRNGESYLKPPTKSPQSISGDFHQIAGNNTRHPMPLNL